MEKALFGAGCFWGVEEYFQKISGVIDTEVGYSGGHKQDPTYQEVCSNKTGHVEVLKVDFDETIIKYDEILTHFWKCHDPTTLNRQGADIGTQYKSIIFYYTDLQKKIAENSKLNHQKMFNNAIVTEIKKFDIFYLAEEYHQKYFQKSSI